MKKLLGIAVAVAIILAVPVSVSAGDAAAGTGSPWTQETGWGNRAGGKLGFGLKNFLLGWTELFTQPGATMSEGGNFFVGLGTGIWNGVGQTVGGAAHAITFPITSLDIPLPEGGTQVGS